MDHGQSDTNVLLSETIRLMQEYDADYIVVTEISKDGVMNINIAKK